MFELLILGLIGAYGYSVKKGIAPGFSKDICGVTVKCERDGVGVDFK